jgi:hypothetical protein
MCAKALQNRHGHVSAFDLERAIERAARWKMWLEPRHVCLNRSPDHPKSRLDKSSRPNKIASSLRVLGAFEL